MRIQIEAISDKKTYWMIKNKVSHTSLIMKNMDFLMPGTFKNKYYPSWMISWHLENLTEDQIEQSTRRVGRTGN